MKKIILLLVMILCALSAFAQTPPGTYGYPQSSSSSGGVSSVSVLPACATATGTIVSYFKNGVSYGDFYCGGIGPIAQQPSNPAQGVSPLSYGALWDVKYITDAAWGSASTTVTCPNSDCGFTTNLDNAKIEFGTQGLTAVTGLCTGTACGQLLVPQGTLTVVSANNATVSLASTAACAVSGTGMCGFAWGTQDDTVAINLAAQAAWNNGNVCKALIFPSGNAFFSGQILNVTAAQANPCGNGSVNGNQGDMIQVGAMAFGQGAAITTLIPLPTFTFANPVIGGTPQAQYHDFGVNGLGQSLSGTTHAVSLFQAVATQPACTGSTAFNLLFANWAEQSTSSIGFDFQGGCGDPMAWNIISEMFGGTSCQLSPQGGQPMPILGLACFGSNANSVIINLSGILDTYGSYFEGVMGGGVAVQVTGSNAGTWNSSGDNISTQFAQTAQAIALNIQHATSVSQIHLNGDNISISSGDTNSSSTLILMGGTNATLTIQNTILTATGANNRTLQLNASNTLNDQGGNTWAFGSQASAVVSGSLIADGHSVKGVCTGVANASVTNSLYGTGPNVTATTCAGQTATLGTGLVASGSRTLAGFQCTSSATTVSVACTVMVNGVASAVTCTMTAATVCNDFVHTAALNDGDLISERIVTGAAETGANIKMIGWWS